MDFYVTTLGLGAAGMLAMALGGSARGRGATGHGHVGHGPATHGHAGHGHGPATHGHAGHAHGASHGHAGHSASVKAGASNTLLALMSPRVLFSVCVGLGAAGLLLRPVLGGVLLFASALAVGVVFERLLVAPLWNFAFRFASEPALSLESALYGQATAVTAFDANGNGLIAVEVDGRLVQLLGTLQTVDRELRAKVVAGSKLRIEDVDAERNRCTVSLQ